MNVQLSVSDIVKRASTLEKKEFDNLTEVIEIYRQIAEVSKLKMRKIEDSFNKINWEPE